VTRPTSRKEKEKESEGTALYGSLATADQCVEAFHGHGENRFLQSVALRKLIDLLFLERGPLDLPLALLRVLAGAGPSAGYGGDHTHLLYSARRLLDALAPAGAAGALVRLFEMLVVVVEDAHEDRARALGPAHNMFLWCCLLAGVPGRAQAVASYPYTRVAPASAQGTTSGDVMAFFYHAGCVLELVGQRQRALDSWQICVTSPAQALSAICVAAYRRLVLLSLIEEGAVRSLGDSREGFTVHREMQSATPAYQAIRKAYAAADAQALADAVHHHRAALEADGTLALAREALLSLGRRQVQTMTNTYLTVPVPEVAKRVGIAEPVAERIIFAAIFQGKIAASVDQGRALVSFSDASVHYGDPAVSHSLSAMAVQAAAMTREVRLANEAFERRRDYIDKVAELDRSGNRAAAGAGAGAQMEF
jgi:hypothetical protein